MDDTIHGTLAGWANFYLLAGVLLGHGAAVALFALAAATRHQNPGPRRRRRR